MSQITSSFAQTSPVASHLKQKRGPCSSVTYEAHVTGLPCLESLCDCFARCSLGCRQAAPLLPHHTAHSRLSLQDCVERSSLPAHFANLLSHCESLLRCHLIQSGLHSPPRAERHSLPKPDRPRPMNAALTSFKPFASDLPDTCRLVQSASLHQLQESRDFVLSTAMSLSPRTIPGT